MSDKGATGMVLQCDATEIITQVLHAPAGMGTSSWLNKPFMQLVEPQAEEAALHFLEALKQIGHAEGWDLILLIGGKHYDFTFTGAWVDGRILLMGYQTAEVVKSLEFNLGKLQNGKQAASETEALTNPADYEELFEELSRLNNELINTKRELIRQNVKLRKLQNPWGDNGLTFI